MGGFFSQGSEESHPREDLPQEPEEIRILFVCEKTEFLAKETILNKKKEEEGKVFRENGKLFFFPLGDSSQDPGEEFSTFTFRNGSFLWYREGEAGPLYWGERPEFVLHPGLRFVFGFYSPGYKENISDNSPWKLRFLVVREQIPNGYRKVGNTFFLSCPDDKHKIGKLRLVYRSNRLIRHSFAYISLENWWGDL